MNLKQLLKHSIYLTFLMIAFTVVPMAMLIGSIALGYMLLQFLSQTLLLLLFIFVITLIYTYIENNH